MCRKLFLLTSFVVVLSLVGNASSQPTGEILFEYWLDIGGTAVSDLTSAAGYPDSPDQSELLSKFEGPVDWADNYGIRARGYLYPPADGDYTLWISGDDYIELYLSTDDDPANMALVAEVPGWTNALEWGKYTEQQSAPITLAAGQKYYIEALMKEGGGGDSLTAAWAGPEIGADLVVIDGAYLSPVLRPAARGPIPADGAVDADVLTLEWTAGDGAVSHKVYLSTDATIDESDLLAEGPLAVQFADLAPGAAYYWRVDEVDADGTVIEGKIWSFATLPIEAHFPDPEDGAEDVSLSAQLSWTAGKDAIMHDVYFGTDPAALLPVSMMQMDTSFDPGPLEPFTTYYWKVDEFAIIVTNPGPVWSFSTPKYLVIDDDETTLDYDNSAEPYVSEASWDTPQDLTIGGLADLTLRFHGKPASEGSVSLDEATGTYSITGSGVDIWGNSDQFHYGYRELTGDAVMVARVADNGSGTNEWAKGGVMIRQSLDAGSTHRYMPITGGGGNGASFQGRPVADAGSVNVDSGEVVAPPYWVKLERVGNDFSGSISPDGVTWTQLGGAETIEMTDPVLIGLAVTSHQSGEKRTFTFDNVDIVGDISADTASTDIGIPGNDVEPLYVALEDSAGAVASVTHPYAAAVQIDSWRDWTIPLSKFTGVDPTDAAKLYVGVGDGEPGGSGSIRVDDIRVVMSTTAANIVWVGDAYDEFPDGIPDDQGFVDLLSAQGHIVDYTKGAAPGDGYWRTLDDAKIAALNAADLVIISRCSDSGNYNNGDEGPQWNSVTTPMINCAAHLVRNTRWLWLDTTSLPNLSDAVVEILAPDNPIFAGVESPVLVGDGLVGPSTYVDITGVGVGNGTLLAKVADADVAWIIEWEAGVEFYPGSGQIAGGPRMFLAAGTQESVPDIGRGEYNLTPEGETIFLNAVNKMLTTSPLQNWADAAAQAAPGFLATNVEDGVYDIGTFSGDITYEFVVRSNPDETEASMCLIGRRDFGPPEAGLKYEQWNNTGTYGATLFGVVDLDYGVAYNPGVDTHLVFVSSEDLGTTALYENGVYQGSVDAAITLYGLVGIGYGTRDAEGTNTFDNFDGDIYGVAIYDTALSEGDIKAHSNAYFALPASLLDVTVPGDIVKGVPDDGDWPGAETPDLAIDDNTGTKYLHFKGDFNPDPGTGGTGFKVTPLNGPSIVMGLTFTTANDAAPRDPIAFELSGSNESIDGPFELIASGDIVDFAQETAWPRFTKNETPISFDNDVAYDHYQILFTAIRDAPNANSMQIAEVELMGVPAPAAPAGYVYDGDALDDTWDHDNGSDQWDGTAPGEGMPGGAVSLTEDGVTFLRIQDTGDPRDYGMSDPTNRKVYFQRPMDISLDGARLEFCARVATSGLLDDMHPDGGAGIEPWPAEGIGYHIRDNGKGMIGIGEGGEAGVGIISFSLAQPGELYLEDIATDVLVMNNLVGTEASGDVDTEDAAAAVAMNMIAVDDVTQWNTFVIDIAAGGAGTHIVSVSVNGGPAESFEVTMGTDLENDTSSLLIGSSGTGGITAFDVDYLSVQ